MKIKSAGNPGEIFRLSIPKHLVVSTNKIYSSQHYSVRSQMKTDYHWLIKTTKVKKIVGLPPYDFTYVFYFRHRRFDPTNCSYMVKMLEDGLVKEGVIENDNHRFVHSFKVATEKTTDKDTYVTCSVTSHVGL